MKKQGPTIKPAQIGKCGELFVQFQLLLAGIESAPLTTDSGIDLVAYSPRTSKPVTIQVKTNLKPKPGGGAGSLALDWWVGVDTPADYVAMVDLSSTNAWLFSIKEIASLAQQKSSGRYHLYMYINAATKPKKQGRAVYVHDFEKYLFQTRLSKIFGA
jgi:hypothetical protein